MDHSVLTILDLGIIAAYLVIIAVSYTTYETLIALSQV